MNILNRQALNQESSYHYEQNNVTVKLAKDLLELIKNKTDKNLVIVCIGTDRSTGDSLGPLVGTFLNNKRLTNFTCLGSLEEPVHALNLEATIDKLEDEKTNNLIISLDACLGNSRRIGFMQVTEGPIFPGAAVKKDLPPIGDINITGIVNVNAFMQLTVLQSTRLSLVYKMAHTIANAIIYADFLLSLDKKRALKD